MKEPFPELHLYEPGYDAISYQYLSKVGRIIFRSADHWPWTWRLLLTLAMAKCSVTCRTPTVQAAGLYHQRAGSKKKAVGQISPEPSLLHCWC